MFNRFISATVLSLCLTANSASAEEFTAEQIQDLVIQTILENPEVIMQAVNILQERDKVAAEAQAGEALESQRALLETDPNAPVLGNPDGDVTVVEFFDYNCPYCKKAGDIVQELIEKDPNIRVVYREWPILSEDSVVATRAALASRSQGKYEEFHWALMGHKGRLNEGSVFNIAKKIGLDVTQLATDMKSPEIDEHIQTTQALATTLGFGGTPSFVIGDQLIPGMIQLSTMEELIAENRSR